LNGITGTTLNGSGETRLPRPGVVGVAGAVIVFAVLVLALNAGGYLAENYRAGFQAVPNGQREAAARALAAAKEVPPPIPPSVAFLTNPAGLSDDRLQELASLQQKTRMPS